MNLRFDHLGLLSDTVQKNQDLAGFFSGVLGLEISGDAGEGYAEVKAGAMTIALHTGAMIDDFGAHVAHCSSSAATTSAPTLRKSAVAAATSYSNPTKPTGAQPPPTSPVPTAS